MSPHFPNATTAEVEFAGLPVHATFVFGKDGLAAVSLYERFRTTASFLRTRVESEGEVAQFRAAFARCGITLCDADFGIARFAWGSVWSNYGKPNHMGANSSSTSHWIEYRQRARHPGLEPGSILGREMR